MTELITNGYFEERAMAPWALCDNNELGEAWICLEDEEPDFPRTAWAFSRGAEVTDLNWVFLTDCNMRLSNNDGIAQTLEPGARASGDLSMWVHCTPIDAEDGTLYAFVCYRDHTFSYAKMTRRDIWNFAGPEKFSVEVEDKVIEKVVVCVVGAAASWFINGISLEGVEAKTLRPASLPRGFVENRITVLEARVDRLFRMIARAPQTSSEKTGLSGGDLCHKQPVARR